MLAETIERPASGSSSAAARRAARLRRCALAAWRLCAFAVRRLGVGAARAERGNGRRTSTPLEAGETVTDAVRSAGPEVGERRRIRPESPHETKATAASDRRKEEPRFPAASPPNYAALPMCTQRAHRVQRHIRRADSGVRATGLGSTCVCWSRQRPSGGSRTGRIRRLGPRTRKHRGKARTKDGCHVRALTTRTDPLLRDPHVNAYEPAVHVGIDNLSFEQPNEEVGGGRDGRRLHHPRHQPLRQPPCHCKPRAPRPGKPLTLDGSASQPGSGRIISYAWDFNDDGKIDTSTGTNPIAHVMLRPGAHTIALTVTNSKGEHSTSKIGVTLPTTGPKVHPPDGGEGECQPTLEITFGGNDRVHEGIHGGARDLPGRVLHVQVIRCQRRLELVLIQREERRAAEADRSLGAVRMDPLVLLPGGRLELRETLEAERLGEADDR